jgi:hypothetical protein
VRLGFTTFLGCNPLTCSDFISTPFPTGLQGDDTIDVIVMDFALDDFCASQILLHATQCAYRTCVETGLTTVTAVKVLDPLSDLKVRDMRIYAKGTTLNEIWGEYAKIAWKP